MNLLLWILAFVLAAVFAASGAVKLLVARDRQIARTPYVEDFPQSIIRGIGALEVLGAIGLILPALTGVATLLVPMAAAGLAITMVFAALVHLRRGDGLAAAMPSIVLAILSVVLAWSRFGPIPCDGVLVAGRLEGPGEVDTAPVHEEDRRMAATDVITWLLETDPALRWQIERDLLDLPEEQWQATRARIPHEGCGAALLERQDAETGLWAGGAFFPAGHLEDPASRELPGQPWTATTWSLTTLREWGMDADPLIARDTAAKLARTAHWEYDPSLPYWGGEVDVCINAMTLANGLWLGADVEPLADWFVAHRMDEGGWNCEWVEGSRRASFHSTLNALAALHEHERVTGGTAATAEVQRAGEEYLLERNLSRRRTTGELVGPWVDHFLYPPRHIYTALRALDHFRAVGRRDPRMREAIGMVEAAQQEDGTWLQQHVLPGEVWFEIDVRVGEPSPWLTTQALRVLRWWHAG